MFLLINTALIFLDPFVKYNKILSSIDTIQMMLYSKSKPASTCKTYLNKVLIQHLQEEQVDALELHVMVENTYIIHV